MTPQEKINKLRRELDKLEKEIISREKINYVCGQRFLLDDKEEYILSQVEPSKMCLIYLKDGNRYQEPILVKDMSKITREEFRLITMGDNFTLKE